MNRGPSPCVALRCSWCGFSCLAISSLRRCCDGQGYSHRAGHASQEILTSYSRHRRQGEQVLPAFLGGHQVQGVNQTP